MTANHKWALGVIFALAVNVIGWASSYGELKAVVAALADDMIKAESVSQRQWGAINEMKHIEGRLAAIEGKQQIILDVIQGKFSSDGSSR